MGRTAQALPRADPCYPKTRARLTCLRGWLRRVLHARGRAHGGKRLYRLYVSQSLKWGARRVPEPEKAVDWGTPSGTGTPLVSGAA